MNTRSPYFELSSLVRYRVCFDYICHSAAAFQDHITFICAHVQLSFSRQNQLDFYSNRLFTPSSLPVTHLSRSNNVALRGT